MAISLFFPCCLLICIINTVPSSPWAHTWIRNALDRGQRDRRLRQGFQSARISNSAFNRLFQKYSAHLHESDMEEEEEVPAALVAKVGFAALTIFQHQVDPVVEKNLAKVKGSIKSGFHKAASRGLRQLHGRTAGDLQEDRAKRAVDFLEGKMLNPALDIFEGVTMDSYNALKFFALDEDLTREDVEDALTQANPTNHYWKKSDGIKSGNNHLLKSVTEDQLDDKLDDALDAIADKGVASLDMLFKNPSLQKQMSAILPPKTVPAALVVSHTALWLTERMAIGKVGDVLKDYVKKTIDGIADNVEDEKKRKRLMKEMKQNLAGFSKYYEKPNDLTLAITG